MRRRGAAMVVGCLLLLGTARPAAAADRFSFGAGVTSVQRFSAAALDRPLLGPTLSGTFLDLGDTDWRIQPGLEAQLTTTFRSDGLWLLDFSMAFIATLALTEQACNPFVSFGPDVGFVVGEGNEDTAGWAVGLRADLGLHGILADWLYWRAKVGFVAVGVAGLRSELVVGHAFD